MSCGNMIYNGARQYKRQYLNEPRQQKYDIIKISKAVLMVKKCCSWHGIPKQAVVRSVYIPIAQHMTR